MYYRVYAHAIRGIKVHAGTAIGSDRRQGCRGRGQAARVRRDKHSAGLGTSWYVLVRLGTSRYSMYVYTLSFSVVVCVLILPPEEPPSLVGQHSWAIPAVRIKRASSSTRASETGETGERYDLQGRAALIGLASPLEHRPLASPPTAHVRALRYHLVLDTLPSVANRIE